MCATAALYNLVRAMSKRRRAVTQPFRVISIASARGRVPRRLEGHTPQRAAQRPARQGQLSRLHTLQGFEPCGAHASDRAFFALLYVVAARRHGGTHARAQLRCGGSACRGPHAPAAAWNRHAHWQRSRNRETGPQLYWPSRIGSEGPLPWARRLRTHCVGRTAEPKPQLSEPCRASVTRLGWRAPHPGAHFWGPAAAPRRQRKRRLSSAQSAGSLALSKALKRASERKNAWGDRAGLGRAPLEERASRGTGASDAPCAPPVARRARLPLTL